MTIFNNSLLRLGKTESRREVRTLAPIVAANKVRSGSGVFGAFTIALGVEPARVVGLRGGAGQAWDEQMEELFWIHAYGYFCVGLEWVFGRSRTG